MILHLSQAENSFKSKAWMDFLLHLDEAARCCTAGHLNVCALILFKQPHHRCMLLSSWLIHIVVLFTCQLIQVVWFFKTPTTNWSWSNDGKRHKPVSASHLMALSATVMENISLKIEKIWTWCWSWRKSAAFTNNSALHFLGIVNQNMCFRRDPGIL